MDATKECKLARKIRQNQIGCAAITVTVISVNLFEFLLSVALPESVGWKICNNAHRDQKQSNTFSKLGASYCKIIPSSV